MQTCASSEQVVNVLSLFSPASLLHVKPIDMSASAGSVPATGFLKQSGIHLDSKGFITVNKVCCNPLWSE